MPATVEVAAVFWQIGISVRLNLDVSSDADRAETQHFVPAQAAFRAARGPENVSLPVVPPVAAEQPGLRLVRVPTPKQAPQLVADIPVDAGERVRGHHMAVVIGPTA